MLDSRYAQIALSDSPTYRDMRKDPAALTENEQAWFRATVAQVKRALDVEIPVYMCDQERLPGSCADALGIHWVSADGMDEFITVDNYFIHECYEAAFHGAHMLGDENLVSVLCHEIAHMRYQRHTKYHAALTQKYIRAVEASA